MDDQHKTNYQSGYNHDLHMVVVRFTSKYGRYYPLYQEREPNSHKMPSETQLLDHMPFFILLLSTTLTIVWLG